MPVLSLSDPKRFLLLVLLLTASAVMPALLKAADAPARGNSLEARVACQILIQDLRWSHQIWPDENPTPKPARSEVLSDAQIRAAVEENLRMEAALKERYGISIDAAMLQAEMDRMARGTRAPDRLKELFAALNNDPRRIADCVARPQLVKRMLRKRYQWDKRIHDSLLHQAQSAIEAGAATGLNASLPEGAVENRLVFLRRSASEGGREAEDAILLDDDEFDRELAQRTSRPQNGSDAARQSPRLQENRAAFFLEQVVSSTKDRLELRRLIWKKTPFDEWWSTVRNTMPIPVALSTAQSLRLPEVANVLPGQQMGLSGNIPADSWKQGAPLLMSRTGHTMVWTGSEMIVWGGEHDYEFLDTGARYNPVTDAWTPVSLAGAPEKRTDHTAVWTGSEMIVWGGRGESGALSTGGRYNPATDSWEATSTTNAPDARYSHSAVWAGNLMIVWGGRDGSYGYFATGSRYDPGRDEWTGMSTVGAPSARFGHSAVWTGSQMIIWGGLDNYETNTGGRYDPVADTWQPTNPMAPSARTEHTAVWTGTEMIVWGGRSSTYSTNSGGRYDPVTDSWTETSLVAPAARYGHTAVWTGKEMIVWGGFDQDVMYTGGRYDPTTDVWSDTNTIGTIAGRYKHTAVWTGEVMLVWGGSASSWSGALGDGGQYDPDTDGWMPMEMASPAPRVGHTAVWTGSEMIVWGGYPVAAGDDVGARYDPSTNSWSALTTWNSPQARRGHTAVWTGQEMIVWGGGAASYSGSNTYNTGGRYNPITDSWVPTNAIAPQQRKNHTAVWTGSEMIIWGGSYDGYSLSTGGRYRPDTDTWTNVSAIGAPDRRAKHTAVWTGSGMIVWGGARDWSDYVNTGGIYDPVSDTWRSMSTVAPSARSGHTAVWTGSEMIVWGGDQNNSSYVNTGGRYDPDADIWRDTNTVGAPMGRSAHTAVWTGSEMIIWGGENNNPLGNEAWRYKPDDDSWMQSSAIDAPALTSRHTAVWTGREMIVWGGLNSTGIPGMYYPYALTFKDVAPGYWAYEAIEALAASGISGGCGDGNFCPDQEISRAQIAVFLERAMHGSAFVPPAASGTVFADVSQTYWAADWIEQLAADGITGGCGGGNYCPDASVDRASMAALLLRAVHGAAYTPPPATGSLFGDVPADHWAAAWIEQLVAEGITSGCGGGDYCPSVPVTRAQMASFLVKSFGL